MTLTQQLKKAGKKLTLPAKIFIAVASMIILYKSFRWLGIKGMIGMVAGMAVMAALTINRHTSSIIYFFIRSVHGDVNLWEMIKGKSKDDEFIEVGKIEKEKR